MGKTGITVRPLVNYKIKSNEYSPYKIKMGYVTQMHQLDKLKEKRELAQK